LNGKDLIELTIDQVYMITIQNLAKELKSLTNLKIKYVYLSENDNNFIAILHELPFLCKFAFFYTVWKMELNGHTQTITDIVFNRVSVLINPSTIINNIKSMYNLEIFIIYYELNYLEILILLKIILKKLINHLLYFHYSPINMKDMKELLVSKINNIIDIPIKYLMIGIIFIPTFNEIKS
jgi:hypothetical protein